MSGAEDFACRGRCEFHGRLYCKTWGGTCDEYVAALSDRAGAVYDEPSDLYLTDEGTTVADQPRAERTPRERWGTCCPNDPECEHSFIEDPDELARWMDTPMTDEEALNYA